jgi:hypothetical protein
MTANDWNWFLAIAGTVASAVGVVFSWLAWVQAKGAKLAAEEAARTVRTRESADEFLRLASDAKVLMAAVQAKEMEKAIDSANNLAHLLMIAGFHRASYLPEDDSLILCLENLRTIRTTLVSDGFPKAPLKMVRLLDRCHQIHESLCGISGSIQRQTEGTER